MRTHKLVHRDETHEVYEITWPPGTGLDWHTHGASHALVVVESGELSEWVRKPAAEGAPMHARGSEAIKHVHKAGQSFEREPYTAHKVVNQTRRDVVTHHTYTPPLTVTFPEEMEIW